MFGEWKAQFYGFGAVACGAIAVLTAALFVALILSAEQARACPMKAETSAALAHTAKGVVLSAAAVQLVQIKSHAGSASCRDHCSGFSHSGASGCQVGCCFACSAVMDIATAALQCPNVSTDYSLAIQRNILPKKISLIFRPPKSLA
jgi:hypothetical protein